MNHNDRIIEKETDFDLLDDISPDDFPDVDEEFVSDIVGDTDGDIRSINYSVMPIEEEYHCVIDLLDDVPFECENNSSEKENGERREYEEDGGMISDSRSDEDSDDECPNKPESDSNCTVFNTKICLSMNRTVRREPSGTEEITRDCQIIYLEDVDPKDVDFVSVATDILSQVPKHFTDEHITVRLVKGIVSLLLVKSFVNNK